MKNFNFTTKVVKITDTTTGESREYIDEHWVDEDEAGIYIWSEGNYSCDCNRHLFFWRAIGEERLDDEIACTLFNEEPRYRVEIDGEIM